MCSSKVGHELELGPESLAIQVAEELPFVSQEGVGGLFTVCDNSFVLVDTFVAGEISATLLALVGIFRAENGQSQNVVG